MGIPYHQDDNRQKKLFGFIGALIISALVALTLALGGITAGMIMITLPFLLVFTVVCYQKPIIGLYLLLIFSFSLTFLGRYIVKDAFPIGVLFDCIILYIYLLLIFKSLTQKVEWKKAGDAPIVILSIWVIYCMLEIFNPESPGLNAWLAGARPFLYLALSIPLFCMVLSIKTTQTFLTCWGILSMILTIKGFIQLNVALDSVEQYLLSTEFANTHLLFGRLRVFSFCSDAGQFGVCQAHAGVVGAILFLGAQNVRRKAFFLLMCLTGIYGMFISGTRGSLFVVFAGVLIYLALIKNIKLLLLGVFLGGMAFAFLKYTHIGDGVYEIYRMRTALNPKEDASYMVRVAKQERLKAYLASRPFGGGLGSMADTGTGIKGTFLGDLWSDSGYVLTWGQMGIVGLFIFIGMILYFLIRGAYDIWFKIKNEQLRNMMIALLAGFGGIAVAHYGNPVMTAHPTCIVVFFSLGVIFAGRRFDKELSIESTQKDEQIGNSNNRQLQPIGRNA